MIVDDSKFMRNWLKKLLGENNFHVIAEAENGCEAVQKYKKYSPDIVVLDLTMPVMNGIEALKKIIKIDPNANIVICTSLGEKYNVIEALKLGAKDFVVKPNFDNLISVLKKLT